VSANGEVPAAACPAEPQWRERNWCGPPEAVGRPVPRAPQPAGWHGSQALR